MENMKSLADQLREELVKPGNKKAKDIVPGVVKKARPPKNDAAILVLINEYNNSLNKSLVHVRFDGNTVRLMNQFKMATGTDVTKLVSFAVKHLFDTNPELKAIIKQFIQNTEL